MCLSMPPCELDAGCVYAAPFAQNSREMASSDCTILFLKPTRSDYGPPDTVRVAPPAESRPIDFRLLAVDLRGGRNVALSRPGFDRLKLANGAGAQVLQVCFATDPDYARTGAQFVEETHEAQFGFEVGAVANPSHDRGG